MRSGASRGRALVEAGLPPAHVGGGDQPALATRRTAAASRRPTRARRDPARARGRAAAGRSCPSAGRGPRPPSPRARATTGARASVSQAAVIASGRSGISTRFIRWSMAEMAPIFDFDNHYYEAEDAFTRHQDKRLRSRGRPLGRDRRSAPPAHRRQGERLRRQPHLRPGGQAGLALRLVPGQPRAARRSSRRSASSSRSGPSTGTATPAWR